MIIPCDFCDMALAFCDGDAENCVTAFLKMTEANINNNNIIMKKTIEFIMEENDNG